MALPMSVKSDACLLSRRFLLAPTLVSMVQDLDRWADGKAAGKGIRWPGLYIISGHRTEAMQAEVNPDAPASLHRRCPSLAVDLRVGTVPATLVGDSVWDWLGARWQMMGGRWGGRFSVRDANHFDLGVGFPPTPS